VRSGDRYLPSIATPSGVAGYGSGMNRTRCGPRCRRVAKLVSLPLRW
jgi:hypothetical protein